jgi:DNA-binding NarL/FixJ family response regulator
MNEQSIRWSIEVLSTIGEGYTQEETAQRLGLSRNQVKYVIEILQEAYQRFTAHAARSPSHRQSRGASSHAE